ncbi:gas vesicle protein K [Natronobiforma cellulositropha]|uniref:gas vesicle protein K n=1 Tax=Natronobiforma cellulositropha TaxID=1679076 RepID=UPI0021D59A50|nr:gas vesicle protein K [Natronobiforma cellulositropha]
MTHIEVGEGDAENGVLALVVTVVELLVDALEREAIRRMESGTLTDEEVDRLGRQLAAIEAELESLKRDQELEEPVDQLRGDLDGLVTDAIQRLDEDARSVNRPGYSVFEGDAS